MSNIFLNWFLCKNILCDGLCNFLDSGESDMETDGQPEENGTQNITLDTVNNNTSSKSKEKKNKKKRKSQSYQRRVTVCTAI